MNCQHNIYSGKSKQVNCICSNLESGKNHMIFETGKMTRGKMCPLQFGKIETESRNGYIIIKKKVQNDK